MPYTVILKSLTAVVAALGISAAISTPSLAHDPRYPQYDNFMASLYHPIKPSGAMSSCCDIRDCRVLTFGEEGQPGTEAWYDSKRGAYGFIATPKAFIDGDGQTYYVKEPDSRAVRQKIGNDFVIPENPTDDKAFACYTPGTAWCLVPPRAEF